MRQSGGPYIPTAPATATGCCESVPTSTSADRKTVNYAPGLNCQSCASPYTVFDFDTICCSWARSVFAGRLRSPRFSWNAEDEQPDHPPDEKYGDDGSREVHDPVTRCFWPPKVEHRVMIAARLKVDGFSWSQERWHRQYHSRPCKKRKDGAPEIPFRGGRSKPLRGPATHPLPNSCLLARRSWRHRSVHVFWWGWKRPVKLCALRLIADALWEKRLITQDRHAS